MASVGAGSRLLAFPARRAVLEALSHPYRFPCVCGVCQAEHAQRLAQYRAVILAAREAGARGREPSEAGSPR